MEDQEVTDQALVQAIRKRLLEEIARKQEQEKIVNNIYGGQAAGGGGMMDQMGNGEQGGNPEDNSYFVDILRENLDAGDETMVQDPETGTMVPRKLARGGWSKRVHRFSEPKKSDGSPLEPPPVPPGYTRENQTYEQWRKGLTDDIDPAMLAGEGMSDIDEIARAEDIDNNPWLRDMVKNQGKHWWNNTGD